MNSVYFFIKNFSIKIFFFTIKDFLKNCFKKIYFFLRTLVNNKKSKQEKGLKIFFKRKLKIIMKLFFYKRKFKLFFRIPTKATYELKEETNDKEKGAKVKKKKGIERIHKLLFYKKNFISTNKVQTWY